MSASSRDSRAIVSLSRSSSKRNTAFSAAIWFTFVGPRRLGMSYRHSEPRWEHVSQGVSPLHFRRMRLHSLHAAVTYLRVESVPERDIRHREVGEQSVGGFPVKLV